jgi:hypothetical protein
MELSSKYFTKSTISKPVNRSPARPSRHNIFRYQNHLDRSPIHHRAELGEEIMAVVGARGSLGVVLHA